MTRTFKFMKRKWAEEFVAGKSVMISTLSGFRDVERHGLNKADQLEGLSVVNDPEGFRIGKGKNLGLQKKILQETGMFFDNVTFAGNYSVGALVVSTLDYYIFCTSREFDKSIAEDLDPQYDCCVSIANTEALAYELAARMRETGRIAGKWFCRNVVYKDRVQRPPDAELDASPFYKDRKFSHQREHRIVWQPRTPHEISEFLPSLKPQTLRGFDPRSCGLKMHWKK